MDLVPQKPLPSKPFRPVAGNPRPQQRLLPRGEHLGLHHLAWKPPLPITSNPTPPPDLTALLIVPPNVLTNLSRMGFQWVQVEDLSLCPAWVPPPGTQP